MLILWHMSMYDKEASYFKSYYIYKEHVLFKIIKWWTNAHLITDLDSKSSPPKWQLQEIYPFLSKIKPFLFLKLTLSLFKPWIRNSYPSAYGNNCLQIEHLCHQVLRWTQTSSICESSDFTCIWDKNECKTLSTRQWDTHSSIQLRALSTWFWLGKQLCLWYSPFSYEDWLRSWTGK